MTVASKVHKGASWLLEETEPSATFTPEKLSEEHRLMAQTVDEFVEAEVLPQIDRLETKDWTLARALIRRAGELGLLGLSVPEEYGGLDLDKVSALVVAGRRVRCTGESLHHSDRPLRHRHPEAEIPARSRRGGDDRRLCAQRI